MAVVPACPPNLKPMTEFEACLESWLKACQKLIDDDYTKNFSNLKVPKLERDGGRTYIKIVKIDAPGSGRCVYAFIDARNGNIYKPASWKAPALNHARGNILDDKNGMGWMSSYGPAYIT
jgi:hypothetical protein